MAFFSVLGVVADDDQPTCWELCSTHAGLLLDAIPIFHALNPISIVGAFWHAGPGQEALGATPSLPSLVGLGLDYKNVPDIPVNTTSIFSSHPRP